MAGNTGSGETLATQRRLPQLEAVRGLAALIVVAWHFIWAFAPWTIGSIAGLSDESGMLGSPMLAAVDGPAAVALFFVLSGFVVPLGFLRSGRRRVVLHAASKRWLRLAGLSVLSVLLVYLLFHFHLFRFRVAGGVTHSAWLASYGGGDPKGTLNPTLTGALREGLVSAFVRNSDHYLPVLWTMRHELLGSLLCLGIALAIGNVRPPSAAGILLLASAVSPLVDPWLIPFLAGTALAWLVCRYELHLHWIVAAAGMTAGVFLFGYLEPHGAYTAFPVLQDSAGYRYDRILAHTFGGLLILLALIANEPLGRALSIRPLLLLGRLSFPIYLFHFPLLCSFACGLFLLLQPRTSYMVTIGLVAALYIPLVLAVGCLFARLDEIWADWVNKVTGGILQWSAARWRSRAA